MDPHCAYSLGPVQIRIIPIENFRVQFFPDSCSVCFVSPFAVSTAPMPQQFLADAVSALRMTLTPRLACFRNLMSL